MNVSYTIKLIGLIVSAFMATVFFMNPEAWTKLTCWCNCF